MIKVISFRLTQALVTLIAVSIVIFSLAHTTGNPVDVMLPVEATAEQRAAEIKRLGLDRPLLKQYWTYVTRVVRGDFGKSIRVGRPVMELVGERLWNSVKLTSVAIVFALVISMPLGVIAAVNQGGLWDWLARSIAILGLSIPSFLAGIIAILVFSVMFKLLPAQGAGGWKNYLLPGITVGLPLVAGVVRLLRSGMLEALDTEYIKLARAKGQAEYLVIWKHAFRNALVTVVTFVGYMYGILIAGAIATEVVFGWPGLGRLAYEAVTWRDFPLLQAVVLIWASLIVGVNFFVDLTYGVLDPRMRQQ